MPAAAAQLRAVWADCHVWYSATVQTCETVACRPNLRIRGNSRRNSQFRRDSDPGRKLPRMSVRLSVCLSVGLKLKSNAYPTS